MNAAIEVSLKDNLQNLKLTHMAKEIDSYLRQARESGLDYTEFLLQLTEHELRIRTENRFKRQLREARFPLLKTIEDFNFDSTPDLDKRLIRQLCTGEYIKERKNVIFLGKSGTGNYRKFLFMERLPEKSPRYVTRLMKNLSIIFASLTAKILQPVQ